MSRTVNVVRLQLLNRQTYIWIPLLVLGSSLAITLAIYAIIKSAGVVEAMYGGGSQAPLWYFLVVGVQALTLTFPFSQAMSVTRREFYLGTLLTATITALMLAVVFLIGGYIEIWTNGWGMNGYFFRLDWVWEHGPFAAMLFYFVVSMLFFIVGFWAATVYKRFGTMWLTIILLGVALVLVGVVWLITRADAWVQVFTWLAQLGAVELALWGMLLGAILAVVSYGTLRRAIP